MTGVIYARYSSDNQREESIEGQLRECQAFAKKNDITLLEPYIDRALSAKTMLLQFLKHGGGGGDAYPRERLQLTSVHGKAAYLDCGPVTKDLAHKRERCRDVDPL